LDGIPLAIELAAARLAAMSPSEIAGHLDARFRLLTGGRRLAVERHQTLRSAVDWSYALLGDHERAVFDRLGVFVGSFDASAASAVAATDGVESWDVLDALRSLVSKSMLTAEETSDGTTRYQLLETLRQYARERLDESERTDAYRRRHAEHYARFSEEAGPALLGPDELRWRPHLHAELDNLRAAVTWALDSEDEADGELAVRIVAALFVQATQDRASGISTWANRVLPRSETARPDLRVAVLGAASWDAIFRLDYDRARELGHAAMDLARAHGTDIAAAAGGTVLGAMYSGRFDEALEIAQEALVPSSNAPDLDGNSAMLGDIRAQIDILRGDMENARREAETALHLARRSQNPSTIALASYVCGWAVMHDEPAAALAAFDESIELVRRGATDMLYAHVLVRAASLRAASGDQSALADLREAIAHAHDVGSLVTMMTVVDYGIRVLASLEHSTLGAVLAGFLDEGHVIVLNPVDGPERLAREQARAKLAADLGPHEYAAARARGAQLTYETYVDYSLREIDRILEA
jgi:tetratricopeptide (TPR) repeat protein